MHVIELSLMLAESGAGVQPSIVVVTRNQSGADEGGKRDATGLTNDHAQHVERGIVV